MSPVYDSVAACYDAHFDRPVDRWEDERLAAILRPYVQGKNVLDLGCGTGWLLDHLTPAGYVGVDVSQAMLDELVRKHPRAVTRLAEVGAPSWHARLIGVGRPPNRVHTVTATWSAHELGNLGRLLFELRGLVGPGVHVLLHGQAPRYAVRDHYVLDGTDPLRGYLKFTPEAGREAARTARAYWLGASGTGALPDGLARRRLLWRLGLLAPARYHYAFVCHWLL
jgi:SAM-dependent methyltransferase